MQVIIGKKIGMTQIYDESGSIVPVTVLEAGPCPVVQRKTADKDGYEAVQLGFDEMSKSADDLVKAKRGGWKPRVGHLKKHGVEAVVRKLHEVRVDDASAVGEVVKVDIFEEGQKVYDGRDDQSFTGKEGDFFEGDRRFGSNRRSFIINQF